jgi:HAD superfamily hydrolase (TIGR01549 family)
MGEIKAILFDVDGTLVDSRVRMFRRATVILQARGYILPSPEDIVNTYHMSEPDALKTLARPRTDEDFKKLLETASATPRYADDLIYPTATLNNVIPLLHRYFDLGRVTNGGHKLIEEFDQANPRIGRRFKADVSADDGLALKPEPDMLLEATERLGVEPEETVYVGDTSETDVEAAEAANMNSVQILRHGQMPDFRADRIIYTLEELPTAVSSISSAVRRMRARPY